MTFLVGLSVLLVIVSALDENVHVIGPERVQEFHACVGTSAYIPWPLNVLSRTGHRSTVINLIFQRRHSEKKTLVATLSAQRELKTDQNFRDRLVISNENSGIFLDRVTMDDAGIYFTRAHISNGQVWTRATNLTVHLRPIVYNGRLNVSQSEMTYHPGKNVHCINITCGTLEYAGYPPAKFVWTGQSQTLSTKTATDDSASSLQICSPYQGDVTCSIAGFSSVCTYDHVSTIHLDLPGPSINTTVTVKSASTQDLVLTIVMPILAVLVPLTVLGIWVLSHILKSSSQYREQQHFEHNTPQGQMEIGDPMPSDQMQNDEESDGEPTQIEVKFQVYNTDEDHIHNIHNSLHIGNTDYHPELIDDFGDEDNNIVNNENITGTENYGNRANEERPLMDEVIGTVV